MSSEMFLDFGDDNQHLKPKKYTQYQPKEIMESSIAYFGGDELAANVWMNKYALRKLRPQIEKHHIEVGYSNSRTCEIGLQTNTDIPYMSIIYLVNECTTKK